MVSSTARAKRSRLSVTTNRPGTKLFTVTRTRRRFPLMQNMEFAGRFWQSCGPAKRAKGPMHASLCSSCGRNTSLNGALKNTQKRVSPALTYPRWKFVKESKIDIKGIMSPETFDLSVQDRLVKTCALQGFQLDPDDPDYAKIKEDGRKAAAQPLHDQYKLTLPCPGKSTSVGSKRGNPETTPKGKAPKKGRTKSTASECKEDKGQLIELRQTLCESEADLEAALNRIKRLQANEDLQKKAYNGLKKKSDEKLDCYDDL